MQVWLCGAANGKMHVVVGRMNTNTNIHRLLVDI